MSSNESYFRKIKERVMAVIESDENFKNLDLEYLGAGVEYLVFRLDQNKKVVKVNRDYFLTKIFHSDNSKNKNWFTEDKDNEYREKRNKYRAKLKRLKKIFGDDRILGRGYFKGKIKVSKKLLCDIFTDEKNHPFFKRKLDDYDGPYEVDLIFETQEKSEELLDKKKYNVKSFPSFLISDKEIYDMELDETKNYIKTKSYSFFLDVWEYINSEPEKEKILKLVKDFVSGTIKYVKESGEILDIFGKDNIFFYKKENDQWDFKIIDPFYPSKLNSKNYHSFRIIYSFYVWIKMFENKLNLENSLELEDINYDSYPKK